MLLEEFIASAFRGDIETIQKNIHLLSIGRVRYQLKEKNFLAQLQNSQGKIFEICLKGLNPPSNDCERFLSTAIAQKNFDLVFFLVSERKTNISLGHLKAALRSNENTSIRIANYLIENKKNDFLITPHDLLNLSGAKKSVQICRLLVEKFKLIAKKNNFIYAIDRKRYDLFDALLFTEGARYFYKIICENNINEAERYLKPNSHILTLELEMLMLLCAKQKKFNLAKIISTVLMTRPGYSSSSNPKTARPEMLFWKTKKDMPREKYEAIKRALKEIYFLLSDGERCIPLLKELDQKIAEYQNNLNVDFSKIVPQDFLMTYGMKWPIPPADYQTIKSYSLLKVLMRESLITAGIECSEEMTTFCWFLENQLANQVVAEAKVFKEHHLFGNVLYHGLLTHFIQIYLIKRAIEMGIISARYLDDSQSLTLQEVLNAFVDFYNDEMSAPLSFWDYALDQVSEGEKTFLLDFTCPEILNQALFWTDSLPYLRGYWTNNWYRKIEQYLTEANQQNSEPLTFTTMILLSVTASPAFASFNPFRADTISNYYSSRPESHFNKDTRIATKPWAIRYQFWQPSIEKYKKEENLLLNKPLHEVSLPLS